MDYWVGKDCAIKIDKKKYYYFLHPHHRNKNANKSQWTCKMEEEVKLFKIGVTNNWKEKRENKKNKDVIFSIFKYERYIGLSCDKRRKLFFSKFVSSQKIKSNIQAKIEWHGYPADYEVNPQDIPDKDILLDWRQKKLIKKAHITKIVRGKPC